MKTSFDSAMQKEKLAAIGLVIIIVGALSAFLILTYNQDILNNLFPGEKKKVNENIVEIGDCVDVNYTGMFLNGTVFDTNIESVAKMWGLYNDTYTYSPAGVFVDPNYELTPPAGYEDNYSQSFIPGFLKGLVGMHLGETKNVTISPEEAYGIWNETLADQLFGLGNYPVDNIIEDNITENITDFSSYFPNVSLTEGLTFDYGAIALESEGVLNATILNVTDTNVTYRLLPENGTTIVLPLFNWNATFIVENDTAFTLRISTEINHTFTIDSVYGPIHFKVTGLNETSVKLAVNTDSPKLELVDQTLVFELKVVKIYKTSTQLES